MTSAFNLNQEGDTMAQMNLVDTGVSEVPAGKASLAAQLLFNPLLLKNKRHKTK